MSLIAHAAHSEESLLEKVIHPLTGLDHLLAIAAVACSIALLFVALRGRRAATTSGTVTRIRSTLLVSTSVALLAASVVFLVVV